MNGGFLNVILEGNYTDAFLAYAGKDAPKYTADELRIISSPIDFVGLNIYAPQFYVVAAERAPGFDILPFPASFPHMNSEWLRIGPETAYWVPRLAAKVWNLDTIYISENGTSAADQLTPDGKVYDLDRIMYLRNYLAQLQRATAEGVPVRGYFLWSLMDNFEWIYGLEKRFRLYRRGFQDAAGAPEAERFVLSGCGRAKRAGGLAGLDRAPATRQRRGAAADILSSIGPYVPITSLT